MTADGWLATLQRLHEKARAGKLDPQEGREYRAGRDQLSRMMLAAQRLTTQPSQRPREALRVACALPVDLHLGGPKPLRAFTIDVSRGGFAAVIALPLGLPEAFDFALRPGAPDQIAGRCRLVSPPTDRAKGRGSFAFTNLPTEDGERLDFLVIDSVLAQIRKK